MQTRFAGTFDQIIIKRHKTLAVGTLRGVQCVGKIQPVQKLEVESVVQAVLQQGRLDVVFDAK